MQLPAGVRRVAETGEGEIGIGRSISAVSATPLMLEDVEEGHASPPTEAGACGDGSPGDGATWDGWIETRVCEYMALMEQAKRARACHAVKSRP